jgi:hypothetical protein
MEMCNKVLLSIHRMVYAEVELGKVVDWKTIKIQPKSLMIAPTEQFISPGKKFTHGGLRKKMPKQEVDNTRVVWSDPLSNDEHTSCGPLERHQIEANIMEKMLENTHNDMVDNEDIEMPYLLLSIEGGIMDTNRRIVGLPWTNAC